MFSLVGSSLCLTPVWAGGLQTQTRYRVEDVDGGEPREMPGHELLETGLKVTAPNPQTAVIFVYRR